MQSLLFHLLFVAPIVGAIFKNPNYTKDKKLFYSVGFLSIIALCSLIYEYMQMPPSLYALIGVSSRITTTDLRTHYRSLLKMYHPDNNPSPGAEQLFIQIREAYELLSNENTRDSYNRFGLEALRTIVKGDDTQKIISSYLIGAGIFYAVWVFLCMIVMRGKRQAEGRAWAICVLALLLIVDVQMTFGELQIFPFILPSLTVYERLSLIKSLYPSVFSACRLLSEHMYEDENEQLMELVYLTHENTRSLNAQMAILTEELLTNRSKVQADGTHIPTKPVDGEILARLEKIKELYGTPRKDLPFRTDVRKPKQEQPGNPLLNLLGYIAVPMILNFLFK